MKPASRPLARTGTMRASTCRCCPSRRTSRSGISVAVPASTSLQAAMAPERSSGCRNDSHSVPRSRSALSPCISQKRSLT